MRTLFSLAYSRTSFGVRAFMRVRPRLLLELGGGNDHHAPQPTARDGMLMRVDVVSWRGPRARELLDRVRSALAGADPDRFLDLVDEDLPVPDAAGVGGLDDGLDGLVCELVADDHLDLDLRQEVDDVLGAPVELGMS